MELGELSRPMGHPWSVLWPKVRKLEERKDIGRALLHEEQRRMLDAAANALRSPVVRTVIPVLLLTGMRPGEALSLQWRQLDLLTLTITVGRAKTSSGTGRQIPISSDLAEILTSYRKWVTQTFGDARPEHYGQILKQQKQSL